MKVLAQISMMVDVESEEEAEALRLALRQSVWMRAVEGIEAARAKGIELTSDDLSYLEPVIVFPMGLETE